MAAGDRAIGLLLDDATGEELGTAFAVPGGHALTALHVVGDRDDYDSPVHHPELVLQFPSVSVYVTVKAWDNDLDVALLALDRVPEGLELIGLSDEIAAGDWYSATGFFELDSLTPSSSVSGRVSDAFWRLATGVHALQLSCVEASAENPAMLRGLSGGPVCSGSASLAVGVIRRNPDPDGSGVAMGGIVMATRIADVLRRWPRELSPAVHLPGDLPTQRRLRRLLRQVGPLGLAPVVREADAHRAGVKRTAHNNESDGAPYVARRIDEDLDEVLTTTTCVIITGGSNAGKSRAAWEAVRRSMPDAAFIAPKNRAAIGPLLIDDVAEVGDRPAVVWLDELREFLADGSGDGLDSGVLDEIVSRRPRWRLLATWRDDDRAEATRRGELERSTRDLLDRDDVAKLYLPVLPTASELRHAELLYPEENFEREIGIGEHLTATPELLQDYKRREQEDPYAWALVRAAADWRRLGMDKPMPTPALFAVATAHARRRGIETAPTTEEQTAALSWAVRPHPKSRVALLTLSQDEGRDYVTVLDQVAEFEDGRSTAASAIPLAAWQAAIENAERSDVFGLGGQALSRDDRRAQLLVAETGVRLFEEEGVRAGFFTGVIASAHYGLGDPLSAVRAAEVAVKMGAEDTKAHCLALLGEIQAGRGELVEARDYYEQAIATGHVHTVDESLDALAVLAESDPDPEVCMAAYRRAAEHGTPTWERWRRLADQCSRHGQYAEAAAANTAAAELEGSAEEAVWAYLAAGQEFLKGQDTASATAVLELARQQEQAESSPEAAILLGQLYAHAGRTDEAFEEYRYARHGGAPNPAGRAGLLLAGLLEQRGDTNSAERTLRRVGLGEDGPTAGIAWVRVAKMAHEQGDAERTQQAITRAQQYSGTLSADVAHEFGGLLEELGDNDGAVEAYRRAAADSDDQEYASTVSLAKLLAKRNDLAAAESVLRDLARRSTPEIKGFCLYELAKILDSDERQIPVLEEAVETGFSNSGWARLRIAGILFNDQEDSAAAAEILRRLVNEQDPVIRSHALLALATIDAHTGDAEAAEMHYAAVLHTDHYHAVTEAGWQLGRLRAERGDNAGAIGAYRAAVDAVPPTTEWDAIPDDAGAGVVFTDANAAQAAFFLAQLIKDKVPDDADALHRRVLASEFDLPGGLAAWTFAEAAQERREYDLSVSYYRVATERLQRASPEQAFNAAFHWAKLSEEQADRPGEVEALRAVVSTAQPRSMWAVNLLARYAVEDHDLPRARAILENAIETLPASDTARAWLQLSQLYVLFSDVEHGRAAAQRAIRLGDRDVALAAGISLGELALLDGEIVSAEAAFRAATEAEDRDVAAAGWSALGDAASRQDRAHDAVKLWEKVLAVAGQPGKRETLGLASDEYAHRAHYALGVTLMASDQADERARDHLRAVLEHKPCEHTVKSAVALGEAELSTDEPETALTSLEHVTDAAPEDDRAWANYLRGCAHAELEQHDDADTAFRQAATSGFEPVVEWSRYGLAESLIMRGRLAEARGLAESLLASEDQEVLAHAQGILGVVRGRQGALEDALDWLALAVDSGVQEARVEALMAKAELLTANGDTSGARATYALLLVHEDAETVAKATKALIDLDTP